MFTHLTHPLTKGESVKATLNFEHAGPIEVEFKRDGRRGRRERRRWRRHEGHEDVRRSIWSGARSGDRTQARAALHVEGGP